MNPTLLSSSLFSPGGIREPVDSELQPEPQEELYKAQESHSLLPPSHGALEEDPSLGIYRDVCYVNLKGKKRSQPSSKDAGERLLFGRFQQCSQIAETCFQGAAEKALTHHFHP